MIRMEKMQGTSDGTFSLEHLTASRKASVFHFIGRPKEAKSLSQRLVFTTSQSIKINYDEQRVNIRYIIMETD